MKIKNIVFLTMLFFITQGLLAQLTTVKKTLNTSIKSQGASGTCWSFSTTSLIESQTVKNGFGEIDLSEMFTVRNVYVEKAKNYILRQGHTQFGAGGLGHDVIRATALYGAMPESAYSGLMAGKTSHDHAALDSKLKFYLDSLLKTRPVPSGWISGFENILNEYLGNVPSTFFYKERQYTPKTFASEVLHFNSDDYINITSFTHHPYYTSFSLEVPDNFLNGQYYNVPLDELLKLTENAVTNGYSVMWDTDISNKFFKQNIGYAMQWVDEAAPQAAYVDVDAAEQKYDAATRQALFENLTTQDDHLMHLVGLEKSKGGKKFFLVKNSWGETGAYKGYIHVSETYFAINTVSLVLPRAAIDSALKQKLGLK